MRSLLISFALACMVMFSCRERQEAATAFTMLDSGVTGIMFRNDLRPLPGLNMLKYMYFYNGAGVGAGDFNNDGRVDLFFAGNQVPDRLYLNDGDMKFRDVSKQAGIPEDGGWSTGVSVVDINNDGLLDLYVCRVGRFESLQSHNLLLVCKGIGRDSIPVYEDQSAAYGLDFSGFSTQAAFLDYDLDGDLDMYLLNHSLRYNSTFNEREYYRNRYDSLSGDRVYRNDGDRFTDVTRVSGVRSSVIGYGLGVCVSDINLDGYPDIYVANDFHENDNLYINQKDGTFRDEGTQRMMHTSQFSMGVDLSDINGDAWPEIVTLDMLPEDPYILRRSLGEDEYNLFQMKLRYGYQHQYTRNNLQLNRGNGMFSEIGMYAGIAATDWSWSALWMDFDNDGRRDLFISNGIPKRLNDIDYVNFISGEQMQQKIRQNQVSGNDFSVIEQFPQIKLHNKFYAQGRDLQFDDWKKRIRGDKETFSNGAVYADLDNDGDLDIVVNNIDDPAMVYRNEANNGQSINLHLRGPAGNIRALGARVIVCMDSGFQTYEKYPVHGFQSSMEIPLHIGLGKGTPDSVLVVWPDQRYERLNWKQGIMQYAVNYRGGLPVFDPARLVGREWQPSFEDITSRSGVVYRHRENDFVEFNREPLIPFMVSTEGPAMAVGDMNRDGLEDFFVGGARDQVPALFRQTAGGVFEAVPSPLLEADSAFEDVQAAWADIDGDGFPDLLVASGGNEFYNKDEKQRGRIYVNDGGMGFRSRILLPETASTLSGLLANDFNGDGKMDILAAGRSTPFRYGSVPDTYLWLGDGKGGFRQGPDDILPGIHHAGMIRDMILADVDGDTDKDLVIALEWGVIMAYTREGNVFVKRPLTTARGWWNTVRAADLDGDGDLDLVAGNLGLNARLKASAKEPVRLYLNDFDKNGTMDQVLTYFLDGKEIPFANKAELEKQMPALKKKFLFAADFAKSSMTDIFGKDMLNDAQVLTADEFRHAWLINDGQGRFRMEQLPYPVQLSSMRDAAFLDYDGDGKTDLVTGGNFYGYNIQMGRQDADYLSILLNQGQRGWKAGPVPGIAVRGEVRRIGRIVTGGNPAWLLACNNDSLRLISIRGGRP